MKSSLNRLSAVAGAGLVGISAPGIDKGGPALGGLSKGTSVLAKMGRKTWPEKLANSVRTPTFANWGARSAVVGTVVGRWASIFASGAGTVLLVYDSAKAGACSGSRTAKSKGCSSRIHD